MSMHRDSFKCPDCRSYPHFGGSFIYTSLCDFGHAWCRSWWFREMSSFQRCPRRGRAKGPHCTCTCTCMLRGHSMFWCVAVFATLIAIFVFVVLIVLIYSWHTLSKGDHNFLHFSPLTSLGAWPICNITPITNTLIFVDNNSLFIYHTCNPNKVIMDS